ncbi:MAG: DUF5025 domain-containing protein [Bacteroidales bacterium]|nr:DUF5025 domain-containing protein [Bacteroidales bacterium]
MHKAFTIEFIISGLLILILGCNENEEAKQNTKPINAFFMNMDDQLWEPSIINDSICLSTYSCVYSEVDQTPYYTITAYRDPQAKSNYESENIFRLQIMNADSVGPYIISDSVGSFTSFALLVKNDIYGQKKYVNNANKKSFFVHIDEMIPIEFFSKPGIKGSFYGIIYNEDNPTDSIVIEDGQFMFNKINRNNFNQCED